MDERKNPLLNNDDPIDVDFIDTTSYQPKKDVSEQAKVATEEIQQEIQQESQQEIHEENESADENNNRVIYEQQMSDWNEHKVDPQEEEVKPYQKDENDHAYNVNFSNESPRDTFGYAGGNGGGTGNGPGHTTHYRGPRANKRAIVAASIIGVVLICSLVTGSVYAGFALKDYVNNRIESKDQMAQKEPVDLTGKTDQVLAFDSALTVPQIVKKVAPSVVSITTKVQVNNGYLPTTGEGAGSGFFYAETEDLYYIATNNHVIADAKQIAITIKSQYFPEGETIPATLKGKDPFVDLAVLAVKKSDVSDKAKQFIKVAPLGSSEKLVVGELAIAVGNPLGLGETVTGGMISAVNREITTETGDQSLIQTDAAINPGNSGGVLVNGSGNIVGINTLKASKTEVEGIGFAIPIDTAKPILDDIIKTGGYQRPYIGISGQDVTGQLSKLYGLPIGIYVVQVVEGSPAQLAGIREEDVIIGINDDFVRNMVDLKSAIQGKKVGDTLKVNIIRAGERLTVDVTLAGQ